MSHWWHLDRRCDFRRKSVLGIGNWCTKFWWPQMSNLLFNIYIMHEVMRMQRSTFSNHFSKSLTINTSMIHNYEIHYWRSVTACVVTSCRTCSIMQHSYKFISQHFTLFDKTASLSCFYFNIHQLHCIRYESF